MPLAAATDEPAELTRLRDSAPVPEQLPPAAAVPPDKATGETAHGNRCNRPQHGNHDQSLPGNLRPPKLGNTAQTCRSSPGTIRRLCALLKPLRNLPRGLDVLGNRYTAMIAGLGSSLTIKQVADFDAQMRRMGTDAQPTTEQVKTLHDKNQGCIEPERYSY